MQNDIRADWCNEDYCLRTIKTIFEKSGKMFAIQNNF